MVTYLEYWGLPQYLTHIYKQFTTVSCTVFRHSFPWNQLTWCALRKRRAGLQWSHKWGSHQSTDPRSILSILHKNVGINWSPFLKTKNSSPPCKLFRNRPSPKSFKWTTSDNKNCLVFFSNQGILCPTPLQYRLCSPTIHFQPESLHSCIIPGIPLFCSQKHLTPNQNWLSKELFN